MRRGPGRGLGAAAVAEGERRRKEEEERQKWRREPLLLLLLPSLYWLLSALLKLPYQEELEPRHSQCLSEMLIEIVRMILLLPLFIV